MPIKPSQGAMGDRKASPAVPLRFMSFSPAFFPGASQRESTLTVNVNHTFSSREKALRSWEEDVDCAGWKARTGGE